MCSVSNDPAQSTLCFYQSWDLFKGRCNLCQKDLSTVVHRLRCVRTTAQHIVIGNFSINRNKAYGCGECGAEMCSDSFDSLVGIQSDV
jgi:hypothetical protein